MVNKIINYLKNLGVAEHKPKNFILSGYGPRIEEKIFLENLMNYIKLPGVKNLHLKYESAIEITPPKSDSPKDITKFFWNVFENPKNYSLATPAIEHIIIHKNKKDELHKFNINAFYDLKEFNKTEKFSATLTFEYN